MLKLSTGCLISANTSVPQVLSLVIGLSIDYSCRGWWLVWCWKWSPVCAKLTACCREASSQLLLQSIVWFDYSHRAGMGFAEGVNKVVWILFFIILPSFAASLYVTSSWHTLTIVVCFCPVWIWNCYPVTWRFIPSQGLNIHYLQGFLSHNNVPQMCFSVAFGVIRTDLKLCMF